MIHRESSRVSVLNHSGYIAVLPSSASEKCCLTTPSLLSRGTRRKKRGFLGSSSGGEFEDAVHGEPAGFGTCVGAEGLLEFAHLGFPLHDFGIVAIEFGFFGEGERVAGFDDHEHAGAEE